MAITSFDPRNPVINAFGGVPQITNRYKEATSVSFKAGYPVAFASGAVTIATAGNLPVAGIALADSTNTSSASLAVTVPVQLIGPNDEVQIKVSDASGSLEAADTTCVPGVAYDILNTSGQFTINSADVTNGKFVFIEALKDSAGASTTTGRFKPYYLENQVTAG